jgi:hypothetical protein
MFSTSQVFQKKIVYWHDYKGNIMIFDVEKCLVANANIVVAKGVKDPKNKLHQFQVRFIKFSTS